MSLLPEEKDERVQVRRQNEETVCEQHCSSAAKTSVPGSPLEPRRRSFENKTELVTLTISNNDILELLHDRASTPAHEAQGSVVIGLRKLVLFCKPNRNKVNGKNTNDTAVTIMDKVCVSVQDTDLWKFRPSSLTTM